MNVNRMSYFFIKKLSGGKFTCIRGVNDQSLSIVVLLSLHEIENVYGYAGKEI
jgi:hypothetical protein